MHSTELKSCFPFVISYIVYKTYGCLCLRPRVILTLTPQPVVFEILGSITVVVGIGFNVVVLVVVVLVVVVLVVVVTVVVVVMVVVVEVVEVVVVVVVVVVEVVVVVVVEVVDVVKRFGFIITIFPNTSIVTRESMIGKIKSFHTLRRKLGSLEEDVFYSK